jgi:hypothetical protein
MIVKLKTTRMKNVTLLIILSGLLLTASCKEKQNPESENFKLLTTPTWTSDSLLVDGVDASTGLLDDFKGDAKFNTDYTGNFGNYTGTWRFASSESQIVIETDSLPIPLTTRIAELTQTSLKITTSFPNPANPLSFMDIRMTFKPK